MHTHARTSGHTFYSLYSSLLLSLKTNAAACTFLFSFSQTCVATASDVVNASMKSWRGRCRCLRASRPRRNGSCRLFKAIAVVSLAL